MREKAKTSLVTSDSNVVTSVHKFNRRVDKVRLKSFVPHTKLTVIVAIIRWTIPLEIVFHLPQRSFSFVSVLPQDKSR